MTQAKRILSIFSLVMINVIAVDNLRTLPLSAQLGFPLVTYYFLAGITFFIPVALVAAELTTRFPSTGGIYIWVREAFGRRCALMTIWLQWIYNIVWYPTILVFIVTTMAYVVSPSLAQNRFYLLTTSVSLFWLMTVLNCFGMKVSSAISWFGAWLGTLLPMIGISVLGVIWVMQGKPLGIEFPIHWLPNGHDFNNASLFTAILFGLMGIEMSATHAEEVKNPQRDYPLALFYSTIIIFSTLVCGSLAILVIVPAEQLNMVSGLIGAYELFFNAYHMPWMTPLIALMIIIGGLSGVSAWIIGPTKGLLVAARDGLIPAAFVRVNKHGVPVYILITQALIVTLLGSVFVLIDSIHDAYWLLSVLSAQMALVVYVMMFAAAIKLRHKQASKASSYRMPGGNIGMLCVSSTGLLCCIMAILVSFMPPPHIEHRVLFECFQIGGLIGFSVFPWFFNRLNVGQVRSDRPRPKSL